MCACRLHVQCLIRCCVPQVRTSSQVQRGAADTPPRYVLPTKKPKTTLEHVLVCNALPCLSPTALQVTRCPCVVVTVSLPANWEFTTQYKLFNLCWCVLHLPPTALQVTERPCVVAGTVCATGKTEFIVHTWHVLVCC
jgi:hypothetical protein